MFAELDTRLSALIKELAAKQRQARSLREDLACLDRAAAAAPHARRAAGTVQRPLSAAAAAGLVAARDALAAQLRTNRALAAEKAALAARVPALAEEAARLEKGLRGMHEAAAWAPGMRLRYVDPAQIANGAAATKAAIAAAQRERDIAAAQLAAQTTEIEALTAALAPLAGADEAAFVAQTAAAVAAEGLRAVDAERASLARILRRKEALLAAKTRDAGEGATADAQGRVARQRALRATLATHAAALRHSDVTVRAQALRVQKLEDRLELVGEAIRGDDDTAAAADRVDALVLAEMQRDAAALQKQGQRREAQLEGLDSEVEAAEAQLRALQHAKNVAARGTADAERAAKANARHLAAQAAAVKASFEAVVGAHRSRVESARSALSASAASSAAASAAREGRVASASTSSAPAATGTPVSEAPAS